MIFYNKILNSILENFPYQSTDGQLELIKDLCSFLTSDNKQFPLFVINGFAGTGKTTVVSSVVESLSSNRMMTVLLAPTGRAAKVLSKYTGRETSTIHRYLYYFRRNEDGNFVFTLRKNKLSNTVFIVDEASLIPGRTGELQTLKTRSILEDLIEFVYSGNNCKLIFVGDTCQLPPVKHTISPAMDAYFLKNEFDLDVQYFMLTEVMRQSFDSEILSVANEIRKNIENKNAKPPFFSISENSKEVHLVDFAELGNCFEEYLSVNQKDRSAVITLSNKRANMYNKIIRERVYFKEEELSAGDIIMIVKNNYFWMPDDSPHAFIANGDFAEINSLRNIREKHGFKFADATITFFDWEKSCTIDTILNMSVLWTEYASLSTEESNHLYNSVLSEYSHLPTAYKRNQEVKKDEYFNALQIKHANAFTCNKTQGGQWENVFIENPFYSEQMYNIEFLRWLYTAVTRATDKLFLINFNDKHFKIKKS